MRLSSTLSTFAILAVLASPSTVVAPAIAGGVSDCNRTEQTGCFEIDILSFQMSPKLYQLAVSGGGQRMYNMYKGGGARSASNQCFYVYVWNDLGNIPTSYMSEYHIVGRNGANPYRAEVTEVSIDSGPAFNTEYEIGRPDRAFKLCTNAAVAAIQFPWAMFGQESYVLICAENARKMAYPNRDAFEGQWFTSAALMRSKKKGDEYQFAPFLFE